MEELPAGIEKLIEWGITTKNVGKILKEHPIPKRKDIYTLVCIAANEEEDLKVDFIRKELGQKTGTTSASLTRLTKMGWITTTKARYRINGTESTYKKPKRIRKKR